MTYAEATFPDRVRYPIHSNEKLQKGCGWEMGNNLTTNHNIGVAL